MLSTAGSADAGALALAVADAVAVAVADEVALAVAVAVAVADALDEADWACTGAAMSSGRASMDNRTNLCNIAKIPLVRVHWSRTLLESSQGVKRS